MDRFIVAKLDNYVENMSFKIQYGQIYSPDNSKYFFINNEFKIQYGQIYSISDTHKQFNIYSLKSNMDRFIVSPKIIVSIGGGKV